MPNYPAFVEGIGSKSALGIAKETAFRTYATPTAFTPFDTCTLAEDPGTYSPATMIGQISTDIYPLQGEAKGAGQIGAPLYATNGIPLLLGSIGQDATAGNGVATYNPPIGIAGTTPTAGSSTSFAATGVTSITLTGIVGTFAVGQVVLISGSTDAAGGWECVQVTAFASPALTTTPTQKTHAGTITITAVGEVSTASVSAGGSTISVTAGTAFAAGDWVQVDVNVAGTSSSEIHQVSVSSNTLTIMDLSPNNVWLFAHASGVSVVRLATSGNAGLYAHTVPSGTLNSYSIEQNIANVQSLRWAGCKFGKGSLQCPSGNNPAKIQVDVMAAADPVVLTTPTAASTTSESPFQFAEGSLTCYGAVHPEVYNVKLDWDNVMKATYTQAGSHWPSFLTKTNLHVTGSFDAVWMNFNDSANGFWSKMDAQAQGSLTYTLTHQSGYLVQVYLPLIVLDKDPISYKVGDVVSQTVSFKAFYGLSGGTANMVVTVVNNYPWPY